jgi:hypothetical protein
VPFEKIRFGMVTTENCLESQILFSSEFSKKLTSKRVKKNILKKLPGFQGKNSPSFLETFFWRKFQHILTYL